MRGREREREREREPLRHIELGGKLEEGGGREGGREGKEAVGG